MNLSQIGNADWGPIGAAVAAILTAIGGALAAWNTWGKDKTVAKRDSAEVTLDGVFRLVNELQDEVVRKAAEIVDVDRRCNEHKERLEKRITELEAVISTHAKTIRDLQQEIRLLQNGGSI